MSDFMTDRSMPIFDLISNLADNKKKFGLDLIQFSKQW